MMSTCRVIYIYDKIEYIVENILESFYRKLLKIDILILVDLSVTIRP